MSSGFDKRLFLHVGTQKTGTTALRMSLDDYADFLTCKGYSQIHLIPEDQKITANNVVDTISRIDKTALRDDFLDSIAKVKSKNIIISDEYLSNVAWCNRIPWKELIHNLLSGFHDICIIVYFRRQDKFLESVYQENIKQGFLQTFAECKRDFELHKERYDWNRYLSEYKKCLPEAKYVVRLYEIVVKQDDIVRDFFKCLGIEDLPEYIVSQKTNPRLDAVSIETLRIYQKYRDETHIEALIKHLQNIKPIPELGDQNPFLLSREERERIIDRYHDANQALFQNYGLYTQEEFSEWEEVREQNQQKYISPDELKELAVVQLADLLHRNSQEKLQLQAQIDSMTAQESEAVDTAEAGIKEIPQLEIGTTLPGGWEVYSLAITQDDCLEITIASGEETQIVLRLGSKTPGPFPVGGDSLSYQTTTIPFEQFLEAAKAVASALERALAGRTISEMLKELR